MREQPGAAIDLPLLKKKEEAEKKSCTIIQQTKGVITRTKKHTQKS